MKERNHDFIPFNHGYLCQMLRSANDEELANIFNDVANEKERRKNEKQEKYINKIRDAIKEAVDEGYSVDFYCNDRENVPDFCIHSNNEFIYEIELEQE